MTLTVQVAANSDVGCIRSNNEDYFGYDRRCGIYVVCDGMGGQAAGEVASKMAVETVLAYFRNALNEALPTSSRIFDGLPEPAKTLGSAVQLANQLIHNAARQNPEQRGMGSTVVAVLVHQDRYSIANIGDSRIYLLRNGSIRQLTEDHSLVMEQVRRGLMTIEEARRSELQNVILRALGSEDDIEPDLSDLVAEPDDMLLLATDGLTHQVPDSTISQLVAGASSLESACDRLIDAARQAGGHDNITCMLLRFVEDA